MWVSISGEPIFDEEGRFTGYRGVARDITERKLAEAEIQRLAFYDELTGLPNRRLLMDRLERAVATSTSATAAMAPCCSSTWTTSRASTTPWATSGATACWCRWPRASRASVRATDTVARLGGDEFVVVVRGPARPMRSKPRPRPRPWPRRCLLALNQPYVRWMAATCTAPPASALRCSRTRSSPCKSCSSAPTWPCTRPRRRGATPCAFFDPAMQAAASARSALEGDIRLGPARATSSCCTTSRWWTPAATCWGPRRWCAGNHPQRGMVSPADFIPLAEQTGLILPLGRQVLALACRQLAQWATDPGESRAGRWP